MTRAGRTVAGALAGALLLVGCSGGAPSPPGAVTTVGVTGHPTPSDARWPRPWTSMASTRAPRGRVTYGRADVDGNGRTDLVLVSTNGSVQVRLDGGAVLSGQVAPDPTDRLQALPDLVSSGRHEILVAATAAGCCGGYRLEGSRAAVLEVWQGRLALVRTASSTPYMMSFTAGRGDVYAGVRCGTGRLTTTSISQLGADRWRLTLQVIRLAGPIATVQSTVSRTITGSVARVTALATTRCNGSDGSGWAR